MDNDSLLGVQKDLLEKFLILIRDKNELVNKANYFLERRAKISGINVAITNQRDIISHLVSFLKQDEDRAYRETQLANAEEHLRRAIIESYQIAASHIIDELAKTEEEYREKVLTLSDGRLSDRPNEELLIERRNLIERLFIDGRSVKSLNVWNAQFEEGTRKLIQAFDIAEEWDTELRSYIYKAQTILAERNSSKSNLKLNIFIALIFAFIGALLGKWIG